MSDEEAAPRRGRRRRENHAGGRGQAILVRVSEAENRVLRAAAARAGMSVQRLMIESVLRRESAEDMATRNETTDTLMGLLRALASVGVNVNQMAKATNASGELPENLDATIDWLRSTLRRIDSAVDQVGVR